MFSTLGSHSVASDQRPGLTPERTCREQACAGHFLGPRASLLPLHTWGSLRGGLALHPMGKPRPWGSLPYTAPVPWGHRLPNQSCVAVSPPLGAVAGTLTLGQFKDRGAAGRSPARCSLVSRRQPASSHIAEPPLLFLKNNTPSCKVQ